MLKKMFEAIEVLDCWRTNKNRFHKNVASYFVFHLILEFIFVSLFLFHYSFVVVFLLTFILFVVILHHWFHIQ